MQFLFAVLVFGEKLTTAHIICFGAIWTALAIFSLDTWRRSAVGRRTAAEGLA
jgi:chloramphenicol-sensitive protein RarD